MLRPKKVTDVSLAKGLHRSIRRVEERRVSGDAKSGLEGEKTLEQSRFFA